MKDESNIPELDPAAKNPQAIAIVRTFRFLEEISAQIEALRKTIREHLKANPLSKLNLGIDGFDDDAEMEQSEWVYRSTIGTFEIYRKGKKGRHSPIIYAAFQISLAPEHQRADERFFPHVAVLVAADIEKYEWEQWECEEFQLDDDYLCEPESDGHRWKKVGQREWHWTEGNGDLSAFVVPLVNLRDEQDVKEILIDPFVTKIQRLAKRIS